MLWGCSIVPSLFHLLCSFQFYFTDEIFVYKFPCSLTWTSFLHLKLTSLQLLVSAAVMRPFSRFFPWFSCQVSHLLWSTACSPSKGSGSYFDTYHLLCTPHSTYTGFGEGLRFPVAQKQHRKMINPLYQVQRDSHTTPSSLKKSLQKSPGSVCKSHKEDTLASAFPSGSVSCDCSIP